MIHEIAQWMNNHIKIPGLPTWASVIVIAMAMAAISLVVTAAALIFIPADYFTDGAAHRRHQYRYPIIRWTVRILRNILGWFLILLGIVLCLPGIPGQGLLTVLLGVMVAEFPGKRRLEMKLVRMDRVRSAIDQFRAKFGREPLKFDDPKHAEVNHGQKT